MNHIYLYDVFIIMIYYQVIYRLVKQTNKQGVRLGQPGCDVIPKFRPPR